MAGPTADIRSHRGAEVAGKRVLVRVDFNVPMDGGRIRDETRIASSLTTLRSIRERGAALILVSHLGRPKGAPTPALSLAPVAARLSELLDEPVALSPEVVGERTTALTAALRPGDVLMLENVRFEPGEEKNDPELSRRLAALADIYVNDAFGAAHRAHSSTAGVADDLPAYAGDLVLAEVEALSRLVDAPASPYVAIVGGAKITDKLAVLQSLLMRVDALLIGGAMANTFLLAQGLEVGRSLAEPDALVQASAVLAAAVERGVEVLLPTDVVTAASIDADTTSIVDAGSVAAADSIFDIGPATVERYATMLADAATIFWNGPMGVFERPLFAAGTLGVARAVAASGAYSVVGGGDSVAAVSQAGVADRISHISTGGGASLELVEGRPLPGIEALRTRSA